jgi:putative Mn2+ efflux pump MntP
MSIIEIVILGVALAMDAFAVTVSNVFCYRGASRARLLMLPVAFGIFQGLMPLLGFFLGGLVGNIIEQYAGIVTLVILGLIGGNMIKEGISDLREARAAREAGGDVCDLAPDAAALTLKVVLVQAVATSIDAFAVGVSLRAASVNIAEAAIIITLTTFLCCVVALAIGKRFGSMLGERAEIVGGVVLVIIGVKALFS